MPLPLTHFIRYAYEMGTADRDSDEGEITRAVLQLARRLRGERPEQSVSLSALGILLTLHRVGPMPAARLAEEEGLQPQSLTRLIASLEKAGFIHRQRSADDRRAILLAVTRNGRVTLSRAVRHRRAWLGEAMANYLSSAERETLREAADIMSRLAQAPRWNTL